MPAEGRSGVPEIRSQKAVDDLEHARATFAGGDDIGALLERGQRVRHRHRALAGGEKGVVVLGIAHPDGVARRQAQGVQTVDQAGRLVDAGGQDHGVLPGGGVEEDGAVLRHHEVEDSDVGADGEQIVDLASRREQEAAARLTHALEAGHDLGRHPAVERDRPIVVARQRVVPHWRATSGAT